MKPTLRDGADALFTRSARQMTRTMEISGPRSLAKTLRKVGTIEIDFPLFARTLDATCRDRCTGFGWAVFDREKLVEKGGDGSAVIGEVPFDENTRLNVHSISKTLGAAVIVHALHRRDDLSLDSPIGPLLHPSLGIAPKGDVGRSVRRITIKQLLVHDSGLKEVNEVDNEKSDNRSFKSVRQSLLNAQAEGLVPEGKREYENTNFALCRLLLPYITDGGTPDGVDALDRLKDAEFNARTIEGYIKYVHDHFKIARDIVPEPNPPGKGPFTRYYTWKTLEWYDDEGLWGSALLRQMCSASAWFISAVEYGRFLVDLRFGQGFGASGERWSPWDAMCDWDHQTKPSDDKSSVYRLGMHELKIGQKSPIVALVKTGGGHDGTPTTCWIAFGRLTAVVVINSAGGPMLSPTSGLPDELTGQNALEAAARAAIK